MDPQQISTTVDNPIEINADGLIHPTTGTGAPDGERLEDFYETVGDQVLSELQSAQPIRIGESITTDGGNSPFDVIVHLPVQTAPDVPTTTDNIQTAFRTAIVEIDVEDVSSVVIPSPVPASEHNLKTDEIANMLVEDLLQYPPGHLETVRFVDSDETWIEAIKRALG